MAKNGRPREHDREEIAEQLIEWAKKDDSINLCGFCCERLLDPSKITIWASECEQFRKAYMTAKAFIGVRREKMLSEGTLHQKAYHLNAHTYDQFLKEETKDMMAYEAKVKQPAQEQDKVVNVTVNKIVRKMS